MEKRLLESKKAFEVRISKNIFEPAYKQTRRIPGLLFADDLVLLTHMWSDMECLLNITSKFGKEMNLKFNPAKSAVIEFRRARESDERER